MPYRIGTDGDIEVLLVTSRGSRRWIPPKGNLESGRAPHEVAAQEAYEEAGVVGTVSDKPLGSFPWIKSPSKGRDVAIDVTLFPLHVDYRDSNWPEKGERRASWFAAEAAAGVVDEPRLAALIAGFDPADHRRR